MGNDSSKMEERIRGNLPKLQDTLRKCFDRPIIVTWGVVKQHTAVGSLKVYSDPARHMEESSVMVFTFPGHNLAFSFQGIASQLLSWPTGPLALSFTQDAYLCNETSVFLGGLKHAVQVYSLGSEKKLLQKLQEERNDLISELEYKEQINFAYHSDAIVFMELIRRQACLGTSEKAVSFTHNSTTLSDLWVQFFYTQQRDVILVPACPSSDMKAAYKGFDLSESATVRVIEKSEAVKSENNTDDKGKKLLQVFHVCEIKDNESKFQVKFEKRDHALQFRNLLEQIQEDREELQDINAESFFESPPNATDQDIHDFETVFKDLHALKSTIELKDAKLEKSGKLVSRLLNEKEALEKEVKAHSDRALTSESSIQSLSTRLAAEERRRAVLADRINQMAEELHQKGLQIKRLSEENHALADRAAAHERQLQQEQERTATYERKLGFLQSERARLQGEVDEARRTIAELDQDMDLLNDEIGRLSVAQRVVGEGGGGGGLGSA